MTSFESLNQRGKQLFSHNKFQDAIAAFTQAIPYLQTEVQRETLYNNRGMAHIKLNHWEDGEADATEALISIGTNRKNAKAWYRRGLCRIELGKLLEAECDLYRAKLLAPSDTLIGGRYHESEELLNKTQVFPVQNGYFGRSSKMMFSCPIRLRWNEQKGYYFISSHELTRGTLIFSEHPIAYVCVLLDTVRKEAKSKRDEQKGKGI